MLTLVGNCPAPTHTDTEDTHLQHAWMLPFSCNRCRRRGEVRSARANGSTGHPELEFDSVLDRGFSGSGIANLGPNQGKECSAPICTLTLHTLAPRLRPVHFPHTTALRLRPAHLPPSCHGLISRIHHLQPPFLPSPPPSRVGTGKHGGQSHCGN